MRLTSLSLCNFKAIGFNEQQIMFRPITLLLGPNSAGKSTIVQALHYLSEILTSNNCNPGTTQLGGKLDLGGFLNLVYLHDPDTTIELAVGLALDNNLLPSYGAGDEDEHILLGEILDTEKLLDLSCVETVEVKLGVSWSRQHDRAYVSFYSVSIDGEHFATISAKADQKQIELSTLNCQHKIFNEPVNKEEEAINIGEALQALVDEFTIQPKKENEKPVFVPLQLRSGQWGLPVFNQDLPLAPSNALLENDDVDPNKKPTDEERQQAEILQTEKAEAEQRFILLNRYLSRIIVGAGELARDCLQQFLYLGPLREIPGRHFSPERSPGLARWSSGLGAWDQLYNEGEDLAKKINVWLADDKKLNAGYEIRYSEYKPIELDSALMVALQTGNELIDSADWLREQLNAIPTRQQLTLRDLCTYIDLYPEDLGTGISQVLPVLVAVLGHNKNIVAIEQPELHVHPKFQVELGELFIHAIKHESIARDTVFILETHSEYMMLRFLRRLYETANDELEPGANPLNAEDIGVYYVNPSENGAEIVHLRLTQEGEFLDRWPNGFFPERKKELF
jgi:hypothetical protein